MNQNKGKESDMLLLANICFPKNPSKVIGHAQYNVIIKTRGKSLAKVPHALWMDIIKNLNLDSFCWTPGDIKFMEIKNISQDEEEDLVANYKYLPTKINLFDDLHDETSKFYPLKPLPYSKEISLDPPPSGEIFTIDDLIA